MTEQEQVQVIQADRDAAAAYWHGWSNNVPEHDGEFHPLVLLLARHRIEATAEALEAMREAREALQDCAEYKIVDPSILVELRALCERHGYGNVMSSASGLWRQALGDLAGGEFVAGPCRKTVENRVAALTAAIAKIEGAE